jgi:hypothetical protein
LIVKISPVVLSAPRKRRNAIRPFVTGVGEGSGVGSASAGAVADGVGGGGWLVEDAAGVTDPDGPQPARMSDKPRTVARRIGSLSFT